MGIRDAIRAIASAPATIAAAHDSLSGPASPWAAWPSHLAHIDVPEWTADYEWPVTRAEALRIPAVMRARRLLCGTIGRLPMRVADATNVPADPQPRWVDRTDKPLSPFHRTVMVVDDLFFYGWSLLRVERDANMAVESLDYVPWDRWDFDPEGHILIDGYPVAPGTVCAIPGVDEGLLRFGSRAIRHADALTEIAERAARTPIPNIELHDTSDRPMAEADIDRLVRRWAAARRGENGGVAYTNKSVEAKTHGQQNADMVIEARNAAVVDIARAAGIPAAMLDATATQAALTYETTAGRNAEFVDYGLSPHMAAICARLGQDDITAPGYHVEIDLTGFTSLAPPDKAIAPDDGAALDTPTEPRRLEIA
ncbi:phage portal protein [Nocardia sp. NPDC057272]|uniref:phage portal protein n=1 Tax=Nocardia sp. NPDC057272 TaxID=3346079 RepID=UPI003636F874